jgi:hypothetical protein
VTIDPLVVGAAVGSLLLGILGWLGRRQIERLERDVENEGKAREEDRHNLRNQINAVGARLSEFELTVAKECINKDRLREALQPLTDQMAFFRGDIKELFTRVDGKQDKVRGRD